MNVTLVPKDELMHYGVPGMKWGVRRASRLQTRANTARASAKEWDEMARYASAKGKVKRAAKYSGNAAKDRADAAKYQRKANKTVEKRYAKAGEKAGVAKYEREKGANALKTHENRAARLDAMAKKYDSAGQVLKGELARSSANMMRERGRNINAEQQRIADGYLKKSEHLNKKASSFASEAKINLGKNKVDSILSKSTKRGYESAKSLDEWNTENKTRNALGDTGYDLYKYVRGK